MILQKMKEDAEAYLGETFTPAADIYVSLLFYLINLFFSLGENQSFGIILWEMAVRIIKQKYERVSALFIHSHVSDIFFKAIR